MKNTLALGLLAGFAVCCAVVPALSQTSDPGQGGVSGGFGGGRHAGRSGKGGPSGPSSGMPDIRSAPAPLQRLDPGALLCDSEAALQARQAAIVARLAHQQAPSPTGCKLLASMTPVSVIARHGLASTEIRLPGPPARIGWTDSIIHDPPPNQR